jgi:hypothetical protein
MKEPAYDSTPVLAVNEWPDHENKNYEEKTPVLLKTVSLTPISPRFLQIIHSDALRILSADERVAFPACFPARPMAK